MDISIIEGLSIGCRLTIRTPEQHGSLQWESIVAVEGFSFEYNCIYGRIRHGKHIGTLMQGCPGWGAICITHRDLIGYKVTCK